MFSNMAFTTIFDSVENFEYLQWAALAALAVYAARLLIRRRSTNVDFLSGKEIACRGWAEILTVSIFSICLGVGGWAALVYTEANVSADFAYKYWKFMSQKDFHEMRWSSGWIVINILAGSILVPIAEEIFFRGLVLRRLLFLYSPVKAIIISSAIFALLHLNKSFIGAFLHGIVYALLAIRFASLFAPIVAHGIYNCFILLLEVAFGYSISADPALIGKINYWGEEMICLVGGAVLLAAYFAYLARSGNVRGSCESSASGSN